MTSYPLEKYVSSPTPPQSSLASAVPECVFFTSNKTEISPANNNAFITRAITLLLNVTVECQI